MSLYGSLWAHFAWWLCVSCTWKSMSLGSERVFSHNFIKYTFYPLLTHLSFWGPYIVNVSKVDVVLKVLRLFLSILFLNLFFFLYFEWMISIIQSSRSLMCSSLSTNLMLIPSGVLFILAMYYSAMTGSFYIFQLLVKNFTLFIYSFPRFQLAFLLLMLWTLYLVTYLSLLHLGFFYFSCSFLLNKFLCLLNLFNFLCPMKLGETVTCYVLKACLCVGFTFSRVHVTWSEAGSGSEGLLPHCSAGFALIRYGGLHPGANSTPPKCGPGCACWQMAASVSIRDRVRDRAGSVSLCVQAHGWWWPPPHSGYSKMLSSRPVCSFWAWSSPRIHPTFFQQSSSTAALGYSSLV